MAPRPTETRDAHSGTLGIAGDPRESSPEHNLHGSNESHETIPLLATGSPRVLCIGKWANEGSDGGRQKGGGELDGHYRKTMGPVGLHNSRWQCGAHAWNAFRACWPYQ